MAQLHLPTRLFSQLKLSLLLFLCLICPTTVYADTNVTLDDGDSRIIYSPTSAWTRNPPSPLDYKGSHMLTETPSATATFNFTGTAIYFLSPLWPYHVTTEVTLDSGPPTLLDLVDHSQSNQGGGEETVRSQVVWSQTDLENTNHRLRISVGPGEPYAIVDGLIYTKPSDNILPSPIPSKNAAAPPTPSQTGVVTGASSGSTSQSWVTRYRTPIILGSIGAVLLLILIWWLCRPKGAEKKPQRHTEVTVKVPV